MKPQASLNANSKDRQSSLSGELGKVQEELEETLRLSDAKDDELEKLREEVGIVLGGATDFFVCCCVFLL